MFEKITIATLLLTFAIIAGHCLFRVVRAAVKQGTCPGCLILRSPFYLLSLVLFDAKLSFLGRIRKLALLVAILCFFVLAVTGFWPPLMAKEYLAGYMLMIHATFAPILAICLAVLAIMYAYDCRFALSDWQPILRVIKPQNRWTDTDKPALSFGKRLCFWLLLVLSLPLMLSIALSMFPLFGTEMQEFLFETHRYTALAMLITTLAGLYLMTLPVTSQTCTTKK